MTNVMDHDFCTCESCIMHLLRKSTCTENLIGRRSRDGQRRRLFEEFPLLFADAVPGIALGCNCSALFSLSVSCLESSCECALIGMSSYTGSISMVKEVSSHCCLFDVSPWIPIKIWLFRLLLISLLLKVVWLIVMSEIPRTLQSSS